MMVRIGVTIHGRVQGVSFRHHTCRQALQLGVSGWVRNRPDGSVEGLFEGDEPSVQALVDWCRSGPPTAAVERLEVHPGTYTGEFNTFMITYS